MKKLGFMLVFMLVFTSSLVFAEIYVSEPLDTYNLGDRLHVSVDGLRGSDMGNFKVDLVCANKTTNLVKISARSFSAGEDQSYSFYKILDKEDLEIANFSEILGDCQVSVSLGSSAVLTKTFTISDSVIVSAFLNKDSYDPGEVISININAAKANGNLLNGFIEGSNASGFDKAISGGFVDEVFSMPDTSEAGTYYLNIRAYDIGSDGVLNEGQAVVSFNINQIVSSVIMSLSNVEVLPGGNLTIGAEIFDQSGVAMDGVISVEITSPENEVIRSTVQDGEFSVVDFALNSSAGTWNVVSSFDGITDEREFEVPEVQKVSFDINDSVLSITNIGNALYNKTINVQFGNKSMVLDLNIDVGKTRKFHLKAPNGEYEVVVDDGESSINNRVLLTGNAISINDFRDVGIFSGYSIVWVFLIVVLGGTGIVFFMRYRKTKIVGKDTVVNVLAKKVNEKVPVASKVPVKIIKGQKIEHHNRDKNMVDLTKRATGGAESALVLKGEKQMSAIVALNIKNYKTLSEFAKEALHKAANVSQKHKGLIDWRGDHIFVVFSPIVTKTYNNEILAVKSGMDIFKTLNEYNKKFKNKIEFNIGVHAGELIASRVDGKLKYTSIGNAISLAKRISASDDRKLIVSEVIKKKLVRDLSTLKAKEIAGNQTYEISSIKDRAADFAKLKDLLKRID